MKASRIAFALLLAAALVACSDTTSPVLLPEASFDSGHTLGSGGKDGETPPPPPPSTTSAQESGHTLGSGG